MRLPTPAMATSMGWSMSSTTAAAPEATVLMQTIQELPLQREACSGPRSGTQPYQKGFMICFDSRAFRHSVELYSYC